MVAPALPARQSIGAKVGAYIALTKPRIIELLLVTTVPVMVVAEQGFPSVWLIVATVVGGSLSAGGANAINMYVDRDIDAVMQRTRNRPLVTGEMTPSAALVFAITLEAVAFVWLWAFVNLLSAVLALAACLFYVFIYTLWLKRTSTQNIVIGGAAGAVPVLIGWSSVTNTVSVSALVLFGVVFFWTPPHFWALAIKYSDDYSAADVPMMPSVRSLEHTTNQMLAYTVVVVATSLLFGWTASMGLIYWVSAAVLGAAFLQLTWAVRRSLQPQDAVRLFTFSITYITLLFGLMAVDVLVRYGW
ncbi:MAG: protoheme IX farnesyltransferase [Actinomycetia bacterium]|nr:protoheme IX farnesyltransferase [Actinomycetes bacterium]